ncbi:MAG: hypothetical protein RL490_507 [Pseudomonadota bacterium]
MVIDVPSTARDDAMVLRRELALRILLQNLLLMLALLLFTGLAGLALLRPGMAALAAAVHGVTGLGLALVWCHHGIRTRQITQFLLRDPAAAPRQDWEHWLRANRPRRILGTRWLISTKGVFIGLQAASLLLGWWLQAGQDRVPLILAGVLLLTATAFLLTNPKE